MNRKDPISRRPGYREPWVWGLVVLPLSAVVIASGVTLWLALANPDHTVVDEGEYNRIKGELRAQEHADVPEGTTGDGDESADDE